MDNVAFNSLLAGANVAVWSQWIVGKIPAVHVRVTWKHIKENACIFYTPVVCEFALGSPTNKIISIFILKYSNTRIIDHDH